MAGIYLHIPFCKSRCIYCGFYSTTALAKRQRYVDALCIEMELRKREWEALETSFRTTTVYLGGGTPSQLTTDQLRQLFARLSEVFGLPPATEVTIECNPDDVTETFAEVLFELPVNRVSMGAQTFNDQRLRFLQRRHTAHQVEMAVNRLRQAGICNISIDLIYGFPEETLCDWQADIDAALSLGVEHMSAYSLTYEEGTPLYNMLQKSQACNPEDRRYQPIDEELSRQMYETLINQLQAAGFEHYEISNFARIDTKGLHSFRSQHNSSYWTDIPYLGLGAAAHSYDGRKRMWNTADIDKYIIGMEDGKPIMEEELIDPNTRYNDRVMLSLRTCEGLNLSHLSADERDYCLSQARRFIDGGELLYDAVNSQLRLSRDGIFVSDMVMSQLMRV